MQKIDTALRARLTAGRFECGDEPETFHWLALGSPETDGLPPGREPRPPLVMPLPEQRATEFWETASYLALGICGLAEVALCLL